MPPLAHADWWAGLVDSLCDSIEAMDASPYVTISAGGWRRVRDRQTVGGHGRVSFHVAAIFRPSRASIVPKLRSMVVFSRV